MKGVFLGISDKPIIIVSLLFYIYISTCGILLRCRLLYDKRFSAFHFPVTDEDAPNYRSIIQNPMDTATLLQRVDAGQYLTCSPFLQDVDLIVKNAKVHSYSTTHLFYMAIKP